MGSNIVSTSFTGLSVVEIGTFIGWIDIMFWSSSVLFSNLYPLVAVLLGADVVDFLLVESILISVTSVIVVSVAWVSFGAFVVFVGEAWFIGVRAVEVVIGPVVLLFFNVTDGVVVGALGSVMWLLIVTSNNGTSVITSG